MVKAVAEGESHEGITSRSRVSGGAAREFLLIWELEARAGWIDERWFSAPGAIILRFVRDSALACETALPEAAIDADAGSVMYSSARPIN